MPGAAEFDTAELLDRIRRGDQTAKGELLIRFRPRLRRMVAARIDDRLAPRVDPSDIVQEALAVAHERLPEYLVQVNSPFYPWLRQIGWDRLVEAHRRHIQADKRSVEREVSMQLSEASALHLAQQMTSSPSKHLRRKELRTQIRAVLAKLSETDGEILILKHLEELDNAECAAVLGISVVAVKKRYLRALSRMRKQMQREPQGPI